MDRDSTTDLVVRESMNVTLHCHAVGYPEPYVMWRREDGDDINYNGDVGESDLISVYYKHYERYFLYYYKAI